MSCHNVPDTTIISLFDERTKAEYTYEVSQPVAHMLRLMAPSEMLRHFPEPTSESMGYASVTYANAIVKRARHHGIEDEDITVLPVDRIQRFRIAADRSLTAPPVPVMYDNETPPCTKRLTPEGEIELEGFMADVRMSRRMSYKDIVRFMELCQPLSGWEEGDSRPGRSWRHVLVMQAGDSYFAFPPTWETAGQELWFEEWEQPYEVVEDLNQKEGWAPKLKDDAKGDDASDDTATGNRQATRDCPPLVPFPRSLILHPDERLLEHVQNENELIEWLSDRINDRVLGGGGEYDRFRIWGFYENVAEGGPLVMSVMQSRDDLRYADELGLDPFALYKVSVKEDGFGNPAIWVRLIVACDDQGGEVDGYEALKPVLCLR